MSNAANTKTKTQIATNEDKTQTTNKKKRAESKVREHKKCNEIFISREKLCQPAAESFSGWATSVRGLAKEMRPICSHRCNINALSTVALSPIPPHCIPAAASCLCGRGSSTLWPTLWSIRACWPSKLTAKRQQPWAQKRKTHTDIEGRMAKLTMIYGPEATGSRNRKSHKSRGNPVN